MGIHTGAAAGADSGISESGGCGPRCSSLLKVIQDTSLDIMMGTVDSVSLSIRIISFFCLLKQLLLHKKKIFHHTLCFVLSSMKYLVSVLNFVDAVKS
jgi:hypothetical protein